LTIISWCVTYGQDSLKEENIMDRSILIYALMGYYGNSKQEVCGGRHFVNLKNPELIRIAKRTIKENIGVSLTPVRQEAVKKMKKGIQRDKKHQRRKDLMTPK
jgi:hypothetical protein